MRAFVSAFRKIIENENKCKEIFTSSKESDKMREKEKVIENGTVCNDRKGTTNISSSSYNIQFVFRIWNVQERKYIYWR